MTFTVVTVGPCYLFHLPLRSRNGPKIEIMRAKIYATPSKNICLGRVLNEYHPCMYIKTEAIHGTLRAP